MSNYTKNVNLSLTEQELSDIRNAVIFTMKKVDQAGNAAEKQLADRLEKLEDGKLTEALLAFDF